MEKIKCFLIGVIVALLSVFMFMYYTVTTDNQDIHQDQKTEFARVVDSYYDQDRKQTVLFVNLSIKKGKCFMVDQNEYEIRRIHENDTILVSYEYDDRGVFNLKHLMY